MTHFSLIYVNFDDVYNKKKVNLVLNKYAREAKKEAYLKYIFP